MNQKAQIYDALVMLSVVLNQPQDERRLKFFAEALSEYDVSQVIAQIKSFSIKAKYFPQLVEIIEPLKGLDVPTDELATIIASEIIECLSKFGQGDVEGLKKHLGDKYQIIERFGGWKSLCMITYAEIPATRAQLRELAKAYIGRSKREVINGSSGFKLNADVKSVEQRNTGLKLLKID